MEKSLSVEKPENNSGARHGANQTGARSELGPAIDQPLTGRPGPRRGLLGPGNEFHSDGELARVVVQAAPAISAAEEQFSVP